MTTCRTILAACLASCLAAAVAAGDGPQLLKVRTFTNDARDVAVVGKQAWVATAGGVKVFDTDAERWSFYTFYDGLADNDVDQVAGDRRQVFAFHGRSNRVSVLDKGEPRWRSDVLDATLEATPGRHLGHFVLTADSIWYVYEQTAGVVDQLKALEVRRRSRADGRILARIDVMAADQADPPRRGVQVRGMIKLKDALYLALPRAVVRIDMAGGHAQRMPLPTGDEEAEAQGRGNRINCLGPTLDGSALWLGLERGLARMDLATGHFSLLFQQDDQRLSDVRALREHRGREHNLWLAGRPKAIYRYSLTGKRLTTFTLRGIQDVRATAAERDHLWWAYAGGVASLQLGKLNWELFRHPEQPTGSGNPMLFEETLYQWNRVDRRTGHLVSYDLETDRVIARPTPAPRLMVPAKDRFWLFHARGVAAFAPVTGEWREAATLDLDNRQWEHARLLADRGKQIWLYADSYHLGGQEPFYAEHLILFDTEDQSLKLVATVPEALRQRHVQPVALTRSHLYAHTPEAMVRYNLSKGGWEDLPLRYAQPPLGGDGLGRVWLVDGRRLISFAEDDPAAVEELSLPESLTIERIEAHDGGLDLLWTDADTKTHGVLRCSANKWTLASRPAPPPPSPEGRRSAAVGVDRHGKPTGTFITLDHGLAWWRGQPGWQIRPEDFKPIELPKAQR